MLMEYQILAAATPGKLTSIVLRAVSAGWEPQGGPFLNPDALEWCQAVVRRSPQKPGDLQLREPKRR